MKNKFLYLFNLVMAILILVGDYLFLFPFRGDLLVKSITSALFFICGLVNLIVLFKKYAKFQKKFAIFLTIGLFFAMLGDILLEIDFIIGAALFGVGHIFFFVSYLFLSELKVTDLISWLLICGISAVIIFTAKSLDISEMLPLIVAYAIVICLMLSKSFANLITETKRKKFPLLIIFVGSLLFFISDMALLFDIFSNIEGRALGIICLTTYYPAEFLLAFSCLLVVNMQDYEVEKMSLIKKFWCRLYQICFRILLPFMPYRQPKLLNNYGHLCSVIKNNKLNNVLIVTAKDIMEYKLLDDLFEKLNENEIKYTIFDEVMPNPTIECIEKARKTYLDNFCQGIIAFGGGSVMDCAKITGAKIVKPKKPISKMKGLLKIRKRLPLLIAIPTTAGTGSETTLAAVITDEKTHEKYPINDFCLIPHFALLDTNVTLGLPQMLTATTGMDALTHAVEAYIGRSTSVYTRKMSVGAVKLIIDNLYTCYNNGKDLEARKNMLLASFMAGNAFTRSYVGYVHAIAHSLGGKYGVAHGLSNAIILPVMLREYGKSCEGKLAKLAKECGLADIKDSKNEACEKFLFFINESNLSMKIPQGFDCIKDEDIEELSKRADKEANPLYPVPKLMSREELAQVYKKLKI